MDKSIKTILVYWLITRNSIIEWWVNGAKTLLFWVNESADYNTEDVNQKYRCMMLPVSNTIWKDLKKFWRRPEGGDTCRGFSIPLVIVKLFCISKNAAEPLRLQRTFRAAGWYEAVFSLEEEEDLWKKGETLLKRARVFLL